MKYLPCHLLVLLATANLSQAAITIASSSLDWIPFTGNYDYLDDQQTGQPSADIVGSGTDYGFYVSFDDNGSTFSTDGDLAFRIRFDAPGDNKDPANFKNVVWVGIDADLSGTIDVFLGLSDSGSSTDIVIRDAGTGLNISPNTTSISNADYWTTTATSSNYSYRPVDYLTDGGTTNDITSTTSGDPDYYLSFVVPFQEIVDFLATTEGGSITINDQSAMRYVAATSTQTNSLNQDLGGIDGGNASTTSWEDLGGFTETVTPDGTVVPEPSSGFLALGSLAIALLRRRR